MMGKLTILRTMDNLAGRLRSLGLHSLTRTGRHLLKLLGMGDLSVKFHGLDMRGPIELRGHLYQVRAGKMEPFMSSLFLNRVKPHSVVLDIGACLGYYTLLGASRGARVYAFEPDPRIFPYLVANIEYNGFIDRVVAVPKAVSHKAEVASFYLDDCPVLNSLFDASGEVKGRVPVETIAVDEFLDEKVVVDIVKVDVQGAELHVLKGMEQTISRAGDGLAMFVECWPRGLRMTGGSASMLVERLGMLGFKVSVIDEQRRHLIPVDSGIESVKYVNLYCVRSRDAS